MNNRFLRIGDHVFAINHIVEVQRWSEGDLDVFMAGQVSATRLYASKGEAEPFWNWLTSAVNATTIYEKQETGELAQV